MINTKLPTKIILIICTSLLLASLFAYAGDTDTRDEQKNKDSIQLSQISTPAEIIIDSPPGINIETPAEIIIDSPPETNVETPDEITIDSPPGTNVESPAEIIIDRPPHINVESPDEILINRP